MELDDLKQGLHDFDRRLARLSVLAAAIREERDMSRVRVGLRRLTLGHAAQIATGVLLALFAGRFWVEHLDEPQLLVAGLAVHGYAVLLIVLGARALAAIYRLDFSAPAATIREQLALARPQARAGLVIGLVGWLLWIPFGMVMLAADAVGEIADFLDMTETDLETRTGRMKQWIRREAAVDDQKGGQHGAR